MGSSASSSETSRHKRYFLLILNTRHDAQECFCGEPNCVGYIGGKTQTDIGGMDDLYIEGMELI